MHLRRPPVDPQRPTPGQRSLRPPRIRRLAARRTGSGRSERSGRLEGVDRGGRQGRRDPTRRRQRDGCCRTRRGRRRPVGYNVFPGQLANRWVVEIGKRLLVGHQTGSQIEPEVLWCKDLLGRGGVWLLVGARRNRTGLTRLLLVRHLPCIGSCADRLKRQMAPRTSLVLAGDVGGAALQLADDRCIGQRCRVAEVAAFGDVAKQPAHDLATAGLRQIRGEVDRLRLGNGTNLGSYVVAQVVDVTTSLPPRRVT